MTIGPFLSAAFPKSRGKRGRQTRLAGTAALVQTLENRQLLAVAGLHAVVQSPKPGQAVDRSNISLNWQNAESGPASHYEIWINQHISSRAGNARTHYRSSVTPSNLTITQGGVRYTLPEENSAGHYTAFVRQHNSGGPEAWHRHSFEIDDDNDPGTPLQPVAPPTRAEITVVREGQAAAGQAFSEGAIRWVGDATLYDVWLGRKHANGVVTVYSSVRNVPGQSITYRELALAAEFDGTVFYGDLANDNTLAQLETNDYTFYVRGVNAAADANGNWIGRGAWSLPVDFEFHRIEGSDARVGSLRAEHSPRPVITWDPTPYAEAYLLSLWKGPDYENHAPVNVRVIGTTFTVSPESLAEHGVNLPLKPDDELYIRVRAIGSEGMLEGLRDRNFSALTIQIPDSLPADSVAAPQIRGPVGHTGDAMPVLRWNAVRHATSYEVWFTSLQTRTRMFLATNVHDNALHLNPNVLASLSDISGDHEDYSVQHGLADGDYRFWVRAHSTASSQPGPWSSNYDFTVDSGLVTQRDLYDSEDPAALPLVSPNLVERYEVDGRQFLLVTNGLGESFGASVLARFEFDDHGVPSRPVIQNPSTGESELEFADLQMGTNVGDMQFLGDNRLVVLSRGSNELRIVDIANWQITSTLQLSPGFAGNAPDAMDMEILSNGQVLVVFNRSDRLRVIDIDDNGQLFEVAVPGATTTDQGIVLEHGRAMQVSALERSDGTYTVFLATPTVAGIVTQIYDPAENSLANAVNAGGSDVPVISRSAFAGPYLGGKLKTASSPNGATANFYLSTDRNGFLTWVNTETYEFGFVDLVDHLPEASRDPSDENYRNPNDNHVDPSRIVDVDETHVAIFSNRERSVLLKLEATSTGGMAVVDSSTLQPGYSGRVIETQNGTKLVSTSGGSFGISVGSHVLVVTDLTENPIADTWHVGNVTPIAVAQPVDRATVLGDDRLLIEYAGTRRAILEHLPYSDLIAQDILPLRFLHHDLGEFNDLGGVAATYVEPGTRRPYIAIHAGRQRINGTGSDHFLLVLDIANPHSPTVHRAYEVDPTLRWYSMTMTADEIILLDRLHAKMLSFADWQQSSDSILHPTSVYEFQPRHGHGFGGSRPGRAVKMPDGTTVVLHDTTPDKVFSVFAPGSLRSVTPVATVHTHNVGQWIFDMQVFDNDRVIAVTWDAKVVILNIRTGVFETVQQLDGFTDLPLDLYGVRGISFMDGVVSVSSPAFGRVADYEFVASPSGVGFSANLIRIVEAPNVVTTLLTKTAQWTLESGRVVRTAQRGVEE